MNLLNCSPSSTVVFNLLCIHFLSFCLIAAADNVDISDYIDQPAYVIQQKTHVPTLSSPFVDTYSFFTTVDHNISLYSVLTVPKNIKSNNLLIYLPGGPGFSLFTALFEEIGPFKIVIDDEFHHSNHTTFPNHKSKFFFNHHSIGSILPILFIDQPPKTGFSKGDLNLDLNQTCKLLVKLLNQFYKAFPQFNNHKLIIGGSSFGIKFSLRLAILIPNRVLGIISGNPIISCKQANSLINFGKSFGICGGSEQVFLEEKLYNLNHFLNIGDITTASNSFLNLILEFSSYLDISPHHILQKYYGFNAEFILNFVNSNLDKLHASGTNFSSIISNDVRSYYKQYTCIDDTQLLSNFLNQGKKILLYSGQFDLMCNSLGLLELLESINFNNMWSSLPLKLSVYGGKSIGSVKGDDSLLYLNINLAGHFAGKDNFKLLLDHFQMFFA
ncbi:hypothetical protein P9112_013329 [Eukaryota sp. TZLM1-RC]